MSKFIPEILAQAIIVDRKCKQQAGELSHRAHQLAKQARKSDSGEQRRILEVLANHLNEQAGRLRFSPRPKDYELKQVNKSLAEELADDLMQKGLNAVPTSDSTLAIEDCTATIFKSEYQPDNPIGWTFQITEIPDTDYTVLMCKALDDTVREYVIPTSDLMRKAQGDVEYLPSPMVVEVPVFDIDWMQYRGWENVR
jgi:hypothetical protein